VLDAVSDDIGGGGVVGLIGRDEHVFHAVAPVNALGLHLSICTKVGTK